MTILKFNLTPKRFLLFIIAIFFCSCVKPDTFLISVPHNYEGYIFVVFDVNSNSSQTFEQQGSIIHITIQKPPFIFLSNKYEDHFGSMHLGIIDMTTHKNLNEDLNDKKRDFHYVKVFTNKMDTVISHEHQFIYFATFITKNFYLD